MLKSFFAVLVFCGGALAGQAGELRLNPVAVLELFTSQGCASCPPADRLLHDYAQRGDVVALAYHVDYWDYVGWADTFALPANGDLQKAYAHSWGKSRIYTPQMVVNGRHGVVGSRRNDIEEAMRRGRLTLPVVLDIVDGQALTVSVAPRPGLAEAVIWLVTFRTREDVAIERGENSGHVLTYTHIVTGRQAVGLWDPEDGAQMRMPLRETLGDKSDGAAIIVQEKRGDLPGPVLGAATVIRP